MALSKILKNLDRLEKIRGFYEKNKKISYPLIYKALKLYNNSNSFENNNKKEEYESRYL